MKITILEEPLAMGPQNFSLYSWNQWGMGRVAQNIKNIEKY